MCIRDRHAVKLTYIPNHLFSKLSYASVLSKEVTPPTAESPKCLLDKPGDDVTFIVKGNSPKPKPPAQQGSHSYNEVTTPPTESLKCLLDKADDVKFVLKDDSPCLTYRQHGTNKLVPIRVLDPDSPSSEEFDLEYIKSCKAINFFWSKKTGDPSLSVQKWEMQISYSNCIKNKN